MASADAKAVKSKEPIGGDFKKIKLDGNNSSWLNLITEYVEETQAHALDLRDKKLGVQDVRYILDILSDSQVTELNLERNCLTNGMAVLLPLLKKTKIKKLNVSRCGLTKNNLMQLAEVLKESQITDLDDSINNAINFSFEERLIHVSHLKRSKLTTLNSDFFIRLSQIKIAPLFQEFLGSAITNLDLTGTELSQNDFSSLFASLAQSSVTNLNLFATKIFSEGLQELSRKLAETKIEKLGLGTNNLKDNDLDVLAAGLINSKVIDLDLSTNLFSNLGPLFSRLGNTQIRKLNLGFNHGLTEERMLYPELQSSSVTSLNLCNCSLKDEATKNLLQNLRFSNVLKLDLSRNALRLQTVEKFVESVDDLSLTDLDLSGINLEEDTFFRFGACLKNSKLTRLALNNMRSMLYEVRINRLLPFLKQIGGSSIIRIQMNHCRIVPGRPAPDHSLDLEQGFLSRTTFTELELASTQIADCASVLLNYFKYSNVTYLNLARNGIGDNCVAVLTEFLRETKLRRLNLNKNAITSDGAISLAFEFKNSRILYLHLNGNKIENDGLRFLAAHAKDTFITVLDVAENPGDDTMPVEQVLWNNKILVMKLINIFKQIAPKTVNDEFHFDQNFDSSSVSTFLKNCMWFYKSVLYDPRATDVLFEVEDPLFSKEQFSSMVLEKFPLQFTQFIAFSIDTDLEQHVSILKLAEEMELTAIVRDLLYNREVYVLDKENVILHPYVYKLLRKYNLPVCGPLDPEGEAKIIQYFLKHLSIEGSHDVITLLRGSKIS